MEPQGRRRQNKISKRVRRTIYPCRALCGMSRSQNNKRYNHAANWSILLWIGWPQWTRVNSNGVFKGSPLERTGRKRLLRNVAIAMGNSGEARFLPQLEMWATGDDPLLAESAEWARVHLLEYLSRSVS